MSLEHIFDQSPQLPTVQLPTGKALAFQQLPTVQLPTDVVDATYSLTKDLANETFRPWYCRAIYRLGPDKYLGLADRARKGVNPPLLFSRLIKDSTK